MPSSYDVDLGVLDPDPVRFQLRNSIIAIRPVFPVVDQVRYTKILQKWTTETAYIAVLSAQMEEWQASSTRAQATGATQPDPPTPLERGTQFPEYTTEMMENDVFDLLVRVWQHSEDCKSPAERTVITRPLCEEIFTLPQAWTMLRSLWPRRFVVGKTTDETAVTKETPKTPPTVTPTVRPKKVKNLAR